jgi:hypothetical protein
MASAPRPVKSTTMPGERALSQVTFADAATAGTADTWQAVSRELLAFNAEREPHRGKSREGETLN